ncbi:hypothetical protein FRAHR75_80158 [Frankia sp. Hr75.2]|nr:hypothetical protein FRAHR75_80158 [Frankia sp. Hr75.2]
MMCITMPYVFLYIKGRPTIAGAKAGSAYSL